MTCTLGIDVSTTATKALLMDSTGRTLAVASAEYGVDSPRPLWSEQSPDVWWDATVRSIRDVLASSGVAPGEVQGIGLTGQMHGLVLLDRGGQVLRPAILWNDQRTARECDEIRQAVGREDLIRITGNDALTGFTAPKLLWVRREEPEIYGRIARLLLPHDYVRFQLSSRPAIDRAGGSGTLLFDLRRRDWSPEVLRALDIDEGWLPETFEGTQVVGSLAAAAAEATGLRPGTPIVAGGGDQAAAAVGTGAVEEGIISLSLGTSGVVFAATARPVVESEGRLHAFCHAVPGMWHLMGVMLSAGGSLRWHRDTFAPGVAYDDLLRPATNVPVGSDGLFFLPYLTGERTPHPDPLARAAFVGLTVRHDLAHMTRSVLEGVAFGLRDGLDLVRGAVAAQIDQIRVTGGGARSPLWRQILADVLRAELVTVNADEGAAYGAALLAATGVGIFADVPAACRQVITITGRTPPGPAASAYESLLPVFRGLYPALVPAFHMAGRPPAG
jgi:xylulokinase